MKNPCYGCDHRHTRCHVDCKDYAKFRAERDKDLERRKKENAEDLSVWATKKHVIKRNEKKQMR